MSAPVTVPHIGKTSTAQPGEEQPGILWVFPVLAGQATPFQGSLVLGREGVGPGLLDGSGISRKHAEIVRQGLLLLLRDLGSTNGTHVNGQKITETPVLPRDVVRIGEWLGIVVGDLRPAMTAAATHGSIFSTPVPGLHVGPRLATALAPLREAAAANRGLPMVLEGETGTGKECAARAIHAWTGRTGPFAAINCAALPESIAEAELFGHRQGAFPGRQEAGLGHLRAADGGTLLLDEVAELPLPVQAKLLRALEQREVLPLGETRPIPVNVQIVAASQVPLRTAVIEGRFRADLLARLDGLTVRLPPLRERIEEVPQLFMRMLAAHVADPAGAVTTQLVEQLCQYDWPANVRELDLLVRRLSTRGDAKAPLSRSSLPERIQSARRVGYDPGATTRPTIPASPPGTDSEADAAPGETLSLAVALKRSAGNVAKAAALMGISRQRAYRLIETSKDLDLDSLRLEGDDPRLKSRARRSGGLPE